ncbi:hypothetical protein [Neobacillus mesonae]|uniref:hypothetical protein n=1 Tax=Neobacillus mesonae TaxID=1193713 RepID=UPI002574729B|nr:hypothetical protein [Neobacillus mesonae]
METEQKINESVIEKLSEDEPVVSLSWTWGFFRPKKKRTTLEEIHCLLTSK